VKNARSADYAIGTNQLDKSVSVFVMAISLLICLDVAEVSDVANFAQGATMGRVEWVIMRASSSTTFEQVAVLVNMEAVFVAGSQTCEICFNRSLRHQ